MTFQVGLPKTGVGQKISQKIGHRLWMVLNKKSSFETLSGSHERKEINEQWKQKIAHCESVCASLISRSDMVRTTPGLTYGVGF